MAIGKSVAGAFVYLLVWVGVAVGVLVAVDNGVDVYIMVGDCVAVGGNAADFTPSSALI